MFELIPFTHRKNTSVYDPFSIFDDFERDFWGDRRYPSSAVLKTDVRDLGNAYELIADLPGYKKEDIKIDLDNDCLTITATRHSEAEKKDEKNNYLRVERHYGSCSRSFDVTGIDTDKISAAYENGVLTLNLPKLDQKVETSRSIEIK